jgi:hypothetical protein
MNDFEMIVGDGRIAFERVIGRSPEPDAVFPDTGNLCVLDEPTETLDKSNRSTTAERNDWAISISNRISIVLSNLRQSRNIDWSV